MTENINDPSNIAQRLEKLNQWQEEQKKILFERQNNQRKLLGLEHKKMCEMLGIFHTETSLLEDEDEAVAENSDADTTLGVSILDKTGNENKSIQQNQEHQIAKPKRPFLRRKQGLINRFRMDPDQFRLNKLPPYKFSSTHLSLKLNTSEKTKNVKVKLVDVEKARDPPLFKGILKLRANKKSIDPIIDILEKKFQKSLISSKTACNSTPDVKSQSSSINDETSEPISWAAILDPQIIKPIENRSLHSSCREPQDETDNLSIFELLEEKAKNGSFDLDSSCIKKFLKKCQYDSCETTPETSSVSVKLPPIPYEIYHNSKSIVSDTSDTEDGEDITPRPLANVRFADPLQADEPVPNVSETLDNSDATQVFTEFKKILFANQSDLAITDSFKGGGALAQEMLQKTELIKERLHELESEITNFKQNNLDLVKSKQEHELEKAHFEQERMELTDKLNDERIQMEIYLHDERMKIEADRSKMEKQIRNQKSATAMKDKKEIIKLREEIDSLQKELKKKEDAHIAAQSRLRAQVRNLEKDVRQLNFEIEAVNKEHKRLESENLKINRQNNNKMLQEINRNIAKLAPKGSSLAYIEEDAPPRISAIVQQQSKPKPIVRRKSCEVKRKAKPMKQPNSPVTSSDEDSSNASSNEHHRPLAKVTFAKSPTLLSRRESVDKAISTEELTNSANASFKREIRNPDGSKDIWYPNGNLKKMSADGMVIRMLYFNKDIKETNINEGTVKYYYAETNTWHTTYLDGLEILEFPNGQTEHRYKDGRIEVHFPNNSIKVTNPSDEHKLEEWRFADGTNLIQMKNGDKILLLSNGQKEIHTALSKRREYPDGTVKLVYPDGSQETRYSNGRVRFKDKDGNLVMDTENVQY